MALLPPLLTGASWLAWIERALVLLVVACPCALVIATPVAMVSALSAAARRGLLLKGGAVLERLAAIRVVALDKTGTVSEGRLRITAVTPLGAFPESRALQLAASVEAGVHHPLALAIVDLARVAWPDAAACDCHAARRRTWRVRDGRRTPCLHRSWRLAVRQCCRRARSLPDATAVLAVDGMPVLAIDAADHARATAAPAIAALALLGAEAALLSGDHEAAVARLAAQVHVTEWRSRLLPEDKADGRRVTWRRRGPVLMVGDGINDGPALAAASVGLAMADGGTAVALEAADGALMHHDLALVPYAIALGRATLRTVRTNVALALALKVAVMIAALAGVASLWLAVLADVGASLLVVALSLRLLSFEWVGGGRA